MYIQIEKRISTISKYIIIYQVKYVNCSISITLQIVNIWKCLYGYLTVVR